MMIYLKSWKTCKFESSKTQIHLKKNTGYVFLGTNFSFINISKDELFIQVSTLEFKLKYWH